MKLSPYSKIDLNFVAEGQECGGVRPVDYSVGRSMRFEFKEAARPGLVSIIIPCFNAKRFLAETLQSALSQSYPCTEIIVVDDGSSDGTGELIRAYGDRVHAEFCLNRGACAARNHGTALARGEYIQYLDADDLLTPEAIANRVAALQKTGFDVAYSDWENLVETEPGVFEVSKPIARRIEEVHPVAEIALITNFWAPQAALTYRRTIVEKIGDWKEWLSIHGDVRFLVDAALVGGTFAYVSGVGARYRVHRGARLSNSGLVTFYSSQFRNACDLQATFETRGGMSADVRHALAKLYDVPARVFLVHDRDAFYDCVARLYSVEPGFRLTFPKLASLASKVFGFRAASTVLPMLSRLRRAAKRAGHG
jgi:glycosyltransferase involved in cell wall biosynthesis